MKSKLHFLRSRNILVVLLFIAVLTFNAQSQRIGRLTISCDYARFRNTSASGYIEFYFGFSPSQLLLKSVNGKFEGCVRITVNIRKTQSNEEIIYKQYHLPILLSDTASGSINQMFLTQHGYDLPLGSYQAAVVMVDSLDKSRVDSVMINNIEITQYPSIPSASDLELCSSISSGSDSSSIFYKNTLNVIPNPTQIFGTSSSPVIFHYLELYNLDIDSLYTITTALIDQGGKSIKSSTRQKKYNVRNVVDIGSMQISKLPSSRYFYQINVSDGNSKEIVSVKKKFFIYNPNIQITVPKVSAKAIEFIGMNSDELENEFRTAKYISTDQEKSSFSNISTVEGRREFMAKFWSDVESGQNGRNPIARSEYLHRVSVANSKYGNFSRQGWLTDRGRVYILFDEPSDIQRFPSTDNAKPYEIWEYHHIENGAVFVFVDRSGFGEYLLVHSTKRGEIQDEEWESKLR
jgi:GWxTD domain-containing protein